MYSYMYWWQFWGLNCQKCLLRPQVTERRCPLNGGCQVTLLWTIMGNMFRECHGPCTLMTSFVDFRKEYWYMLIISTAKSKFLLKSPFFSSDSQRSFPWFSLNNVFHPNYMQYNPEIHQDIILVSILCFLIISSKLFFALKEQYI
jgi:hypothetical protein